MSSIFFQGFQHNYGTSLNIWATIIKMGYFITIFTRTRDKFYYFWVKIEIVNLKINIIIIVNKLFTRRLPKIKLK